MRSGKSRLDEHFPEFLNYVTPPDASVEPDEDAEVLVSHQVSVISLEFYVFISETGGASQVLHPGPVFEHHD